MDIQAFRSLDDISHRHIYVNVRQLPYGISPDQFRMTDFFRRDARFEAMLAKHYRLTDSDPNFEIFEARSKVERIKGVTCYSVR